MKSCYPESGPEAAGLTYSGHQTLQQGNKFDTEQYLPFHTVSTGQSAGKRIGVV